MRRQIIQIDEDKCNGCGLCVPSCAEGAIQIIDGKAKLVGENLCDGLGACLGDCPQDALNIVEAEAQAFDEEAVEEHLNKLKEKSTPKHSSGCPGMQVVNMERKEPLKGPKGVSQLSQWPVQLNLVPVNAPYFENADLLIAADCVPFAYADFHNEFLAGRALTIGCPKLDDSSHYLDKLTQIIKNNNLQSITVLHMEVPCCFGLVGIVRQALAASGKDVPVQMVNISISGEILP